MQPPLPPLQVIALNRAGFGPRPGDLERVAQVGFVNYIERQLDPLSIPDAEAEQRIADGGFTTLDKSLDQLWQDHVVDANGDPALEILPYQETAAATLIRQIYSERQLFEVIVEFWHNHFNVPGVGASAVYVHYDRDVIRQHALGNFRELLEAVAQSTAMLIYLDNFTNSDAGPNENFARELFELHTLGIENYYGLIPQDQVPVDGNGDPLGYVDEDVYEGTRCFTGWTIAWDPDDPNQPEPGTFYYHDEWHDRFQKHVLGMTLPSDQPPLKDGRDVFDALASMPGTGRHIARKLCRRLISDDPPDSLVDQAADVFTTEWQAPDQIASVVRTIVLSPEFRSTWGEKVKRPVEIAVSALRAGQVDFGFRLDNPDTVAFGIALTQAGQGYFQHPRPDGYPDTMAAWLSTSPRAMSWRFVNSFAAAFDADTGIHYMDLVGQTPPDVRSSNAIVEFWVDRIFGRPIRPADRTEVVEFMAQGVNPDFDLPLDEDPEIQDRLRSMVGLLFMLPDFLWR